MPQIRAVAAGADRGREGARHRDGPGRARDQGRRDRRAARARAPRRRRAALRGRSALVAAARARDQEPLRRRGRGRLLRDARGRHRRAHRPVRAVPVRPRGRGARHLRDDHRRRAAARWSPRCRRWSTSAANGGTPRRAVSDLDSARVAMLLAVLDPAQPAAARRTRGLRRDRRRHRGERAGRRPRHRAGARRPPRASCRSRPRCAPSARCRCPATSAGCRPSGAGSPKPPGSGSPPRSSRPPHGGAGVAVDGHPDRRRWRRSPRPLVTAVQNLSPRRARAAPGRAGRSSVRSTRPRAVSAAGDVLDFGASPTQPGSPHAGHDRARRGAARRPRHGRPGHRAARRARTDPARQHRRPDRARLGPGRRDAVHRRLPPRRRVLGHPAARAVQDGRRGRADQRRRADPAGGHAPDARPGDPDRGVRHPAPHRAAGRPADRLPGHLGVAVDADHQPLPRRPPLRARRAPASCSPARTRRSTPWSATRRASTRCPTRCPRWRSRTWSPSATSPWSRSGWRWCAASPTRSPARSSSWAPTAGCSRCSSRS